MTRNTVPMKRKRLTRQESKALTRRRILDAAGAVFARRGFDGASVEEVAETAGFSKGAVYSNFESKEDLFLALLDERMDAQMRAFRDVFATARTAGARLEALDRVYGALLTQERDWCLLATEFWLYAVRNPRVKQKLAARRRATREQIAQLLARYFEESGLELKLPAEELAAMVIALSDGLSMQTYLDPKGVPGDLFSAAMATLLGSFEARA